jgi:hypothetical protein
VIANLVPLMSQRGTTTGAAAVALGLGGKGQVLGALGYQTLVRRVGVVPRTVIIMAGVALTPAPLGVLSAYTASVAAAIGAGVMRGIMTLLQATAVSRAGTQPVTGRARSSWLRELIPSWPNTPCTRRPAARRLPAGHPRRRVTDDP